MTCQTICDCRNFSEYEACTEEVPCGCTYASESPCAYAILSPCNTGGTYTGDTTDPNRLLRPRLRWITMLWRDCLFGCTWSARYGMYFYAGGGNPCILNGAIPLPDICDQGAIVDGSGVEYPNDLLPTGMVDDSCSAPCLQPMIPLCDGEHLPTMHFGCGPMPQDVHGGSSDHCGWGDQYNSSSLHSECNSELKVWILNADLLVEGGGGNLGATLTAYAYRDIYANAAGGGPVGMFPVLHYRCSEFNHLGRSTFTFDGYGVPGATFDPDDPVYKGYPDRLCVTAYSSRYIHKCTTAADACACEDAGWSEILVPNNISCDNTAGDYLTLTRTYDATLVVDGIDITAEACGIPTGPCGYFYGGADTTCGTPGTDPNRFMIYFLWCDGSQWKYRVCCVKLTSNGSGESTAIESVAVVCDGSYTRPEACTMTNIWPAIPCDTSGSECCEECEPTVPSVCCATDTPSTLYATLTSAGCSNINGQVVTLNYAGTIGSGASEQDAWTGTFTPSGCGTLTFTFAIYTASPCEYDMAITSGATTYWGALDTGIAPLASVCPVTSIAHTANFGFFVGCCVLQSVTATVTT